MAARPRKKEGEKRTVRYETLWSPQEMKKLQFKASWQEMIPIEYIRLKTIGSPQETYQPAPDRLELIEACAVTRKLGIAILALLAASGDALEVETERELRKLAKQINITYPKLIEKLDHGNLHGKHKR